MSGGSIAVLIVHVLAGAAWFGAMVFSFTTFQPRLKRLFDNDEQSEEVITFVAAGARWKVLSAFAVMGLSGSFLLIVEWSQHRSGTWTALMLVKSGAFVIALAVFAHASWTLWPRRVFARDAEVAAVRAAFGRVGITLIAIALIEFAAGILARFV